MADHQHAPVAHGLALAVLVPEQKAAFVVEPQEELWIGGHLGLHDQRGLGVELLGGRQEEAIESHFPLFDHRGCEGVALHLRQQGGHQGLEPLGAVLEEPEEELVAGDHRGLERGVVRLAWGCGSDGYP